MKNKIAFIGLGIMGANMASHLIKFNQLNIISRKSSKTEKFIRKFKNNNNLIIYDNLKELTKNSNIIISCVGNDKDLINIYLSKGGILENINKNSIIVDHTTASAKISKEIYKKFYRKGSYFYDAPISGGEIGAINGSLSIMVGGHKKNFSHLKAILGLYSKVLIYMGKSGNGQLAKMVNQICVASIIQGLAEGLSFAKKKNLTLIAYQGS